MALDNRITAGIFRDPLLRYSLVNGKPHVEQVVNRPTVYLDQWMWADRSEDAALQDQFLEVMAKKNASLIYSSFTFSELVRIKDKQQLLAIKKVMDACDFGFISADPLEVMKREKMVKSGLGKHNPAVDCELVQYLEEVTDPLKPMKASSILSQLLETASPEQHKTLVDEFGSKLESLIETSRSNFSAQSKPRSAERRKLRRREKPPTVYLFEAAVDFIVRNHNMKMGRREWVDVIHTIVSVSYLDMVLLDKSWCTFVRQLNLAPGNMARVYARSEISNFLDDIVKWRSI